MKTQNPNMHAINQCRPSLKFMGMTAFICLLSFGLTGRLSAQTTSLEAESLSPVGTGATVSISNDANASGGVVEFLNSTAAGQIMTFTTPSITAGTYQVQMRYKPNTSRGQLTVKVDGIQVGGTLDEYSTSQTYRTATLGNATLASTGAHTIALTVTGKNASATQFYITADSFTLTSQTQQAAAPVFSPAAGTYSSAQSVTITSSTGGASIRYTTDGSTPSETAGTLYSGPVSISATTTLNAIAFETGFTDSAVTSGTYTITTVPPPQVAAPTFSPAAGTYSTTQSVTISTTTSGASIRYTTDGSTPSETAGTLYSGPVSISVTTTLTAIAYETGFTDSTVTSGTYTISAGPPPTFNFEVESLSPVGTGATVSISNDTNASGGVVEFLNSTAAGQTMTLTTPSMPAGTYQVQLRYKTNTSRGQLTVKVDGTQVGGTLDEYATTQAYLTATLGNATLTSSGAHTIVLTVTGKNSSATQFYITADKLTFTGQSGGNTVAAPSFSPAAGTYSSAQSVTISTSTSGASIRYTTDGSTPSETAGTLYSSAVSISATTTLKAIAYKSGMTDSAVTSGTYTIGTGSGNYTAAQVLAGIQAHMTSSVQVNTKPHINTMTRAMNVNVYQVTTGVFAYTSSMAIDTDGSDPDPDPDHQGQTTWQDSSGAQLGAHHVAFYVLGDDCWDNEGGSHITPCPHFFYSEHNITGRQFALIFYNGKVIGAVFGDTQTANNQTTSDNDARELGEASVEAATLLGIPSSGTTGGVDNGVTVVIFSGSSWVIPGTNKGTGPVGSATGSLNGNAQARVQQALNQLGSTWNL